MSDEQLGLTGAFFLWVYAICCPIAGVVGDRFSKRILVVSSLILWSFVTIATGLVRSGWQLLGLRAAMGVSESLFLPTAIALTASVFPAQLRSRALAILTTAQIAGTVVGSWFGGWMADHGIWRYAFFALGAVGMIYSIPYSFFLHHANQSTEKPRLLNQSTASGTELSSMILKTPTFQVLCIVFPVFVFGLWLLYGWLPTFLHDKFALSQSDAALDATLYLQSSTAIGLLGGGWLADKLLRVTRASRFYLMFASLILCAPCLHAIGSCENQAQTRIAAAAFGIFSGLLMGNVFASAFEVVAVGNRATAVGMLNLSGGLVSGFATLLGGRWRAWLGIDRLLTFTGIAYLCAGALLLICILVFFRRDSQKHAVP
ncbi:MAG: MFS transporter [Pirellulales bacterium]